MIYRSNGTVKQWRYDGMAQERSPCALFCMSTALGSVLKRKKYMFLEFRLHGTSNNGPSHYN